MTRGIREMSFQIGKRWIPKLNATLRKLVKQDPTIKLNVEKRDGTAFRIIMESDHQDFIRLDANIRNIVVGRIEKVIHG